MPAGWWPTPETSPAGRPTPAPRSDGPAPGRDDRCGRGRPLPRRPCALPHGRTRTSSCDWSWRRRGSCSTSSVPARSTWPSWCNRPGRRGPSSSCPCSRSRWWWSPLGHVGRAHRGVGTVGALPARVAHPGDDRTGAACARSNRSRWWPSPTSPRSSERWPVSAWAGPALPEVQAAGSIGRRRSPAKSRPGAHDPPARPRSPRRPGRAPRRRPPRRRSSPLTRALPGEGWWARRRPPPAGSTRPASTSVRRGGVLHPARAISGLDRSVGVVAVAASPVPATTTRRTWSRRPLPVGVRGGDRPGLRTSPVDDQLVVGDALLAERRLVRCRRCTPARRWRTVAGSPVRSSVNGVAVTRRERRHLPGVGCRSRGAGARRCRSRRRGRCRRGVPGGRARRCRR